MENSTCIFCKENNPDILIEENGYKGRKCRRCGLVYVSPRPSFSEIQDLYSRSKAEQYADMYIHDGFGSRLYARHALQIIKKFMERGSLLEIGSGGGYFLDEARKRGYDVYGNELNKIEADFIRKKRKIPCEDTPLDINSFNGKKFDIIYHRNVLSHLSDPIGLFKVINAKLEDSGILVFETGNIGEMDEKYYKSFTVFGLPDHLFFFGENSLKELLKESNFTFMKIYKYSILLQLSALRSVRWLTAFLRTRRKERLSKDNVLNTGLKKSKLEYIMYNLWDLFCFITDYKIGAVLPKRGRPQTVIVVAQKKKDF